MILCYIVSLAVLCGWSQSQEQTYLVTGPRLWRVGAQETVVVQAFGQKSNFPISISLLSYPDMQTQYDSKQLNLAPSSNFQGLVKLQIQPKALPRKDGTQQFVYLEAKSQAFKKMEKVPVTHQNGFLFIQTDKPVYTPDQSVKLRVYSMDEELRPARRTVTVTFKDPDEVKMDIISQPDVTGVVSFPDFKIPANPKFGLWTVEAAYETDFITSSVAKFEVKEYVLPRFSVSIEPEQNFISFDKFTDFTIKVRANYYYTKKVWEGKVFIRYGLIVDGVRKMMPKSIDVSQIYNGEADFHFNSQRAVQELGYSQLEELDGFQLYITVTVEETSGAQSEESENSNVKYVITPYTLKLIGTPLFVKPTLPYHIKVQVKDNLDNPVGRIPLTLSGEMIKEGGEVAAINNNRVQTQVTDNRGTAVFVLNIPADASSLDFKITTEDKNLPEENQGSGQFTATSYKSLTKSYLYINWARESQVLKVGDYLNVQVVPSSPYLAKLTHYSYLIISKGKILKYDTVERVYESVSQNLNIAITPDMVPSIRVLVYYILTGDTTAEIVTDSIWVEVDEKCVNNQKVQLSTSMQGSYKPKANVPLTIKAESGTIVALSAVDVAVYDVTRKGQRPLERVFRKLEESDLGCGAGAGQDNVDVFYLAGLTFLTNANIQASQKTDTKCNAILRSRRSAADEVKEAASNYKDHRLQKCCLDGGTSYREDKDCARAARKVRKNNMKPQCVKAFENCCNLAKRIKDQLDLEQKDLHMGRMYIRTVFDLDEPEIRSYFPESWFWEERVIPSRVNSLKLTPTLPDSLTTWQFQGIGMSDKGICVADPLQITVFKDLFLDVQLPYSVVRGEQVEIQVTVYNYQNSIVKSCVTVSVGKEICLVSKAFSIDRFARHRGCYEDIKPLEPKTYTYTLLPLTLGLHPIKFTLNIPFNSEVLVKMLRVVPEGLKEERSAGFTLDPQGLRGITKRQQELSYRLPANIVPKSSITRILSINGNILGEVIDTVLNKESVNYLVSIPRGSAEGELMRIAPIFYVYHYLQTKKEWSLLGPNTFMEQIDMKKKLKEGVSSLLSFRNRDFSYSLWRDGDPSTWLTAFALRIFGDVQRYVRVDEMSVCNSLLWLIKNCQSAQGAFEEKSASQPVRLQGTIPREASEKALYLTAYSVLGIQKSIHLCPIAEIEDALNLAIEYLSKHVNNAQSTFTLAVTAYALSISEASLQSKHYTLAKLKGEAFTKGTGSPVYRYWKDTFKKFDATAPSAETAKMVETTAYALLSILKAAEKEYAKPVIRWLKEQQRYGGGFFSTQDTIIALEALTEVAILDEKLALDMDVKVSYKKSGDFKSYHLTEKSPFTRPVEVPLPEDLVINTRSSNGIATGNVRTVYNIISPSQDSCKFDITIQRKANAVDEERSIFDEDTSGMLHLEACARYKPKENELPTSGQTVMEITLVTGLEADEKHLNKLVNRVDQYVVDYSVEDGKVVLHFDWISSDEYICATILVRRLFKVAMANPGLFRVYEFHAPEQQCTIFFNPYKDDNLVRVCTGDACRCMEGECPNVKPEVDDSMTLEKRKSYACQAGVTYAYKVQSVTSEEDGDFVKYTAKIIDILNRGTAFVRVNNQIRFIKKKMCTAFTMETGKEYLLMGKEGTLVRDSQEIQYEYPLDSSTWVEWWPQPDTCRGSKCGQFLDVLEEFSEHLPTEGCV